MSEFKLNYTGQEIQNRLDKIDEIDTLQSRMDTLTSLPEGSTTGDAELIDIRVKVDGTTAPTAGIAVREQISELKGDLNALKETGIPSADIEKAVSDYLTKHPVSGGLSEAQVNSLIDNKLGVIENGTY